MSDLLVKDATVLFSPFFLFRIIIRAEATQTGRQDK